MLVTNDASAWERACAFRDHGRSPASALPQTQEENGSRGFRWVHDSIGTNWRMTEVQSAVGRIQLRKLSGWLKKRRANAAKLTERLARIEAVRVAVPSAYEAPAWYRFYAFVRPERLNRGCSRDRIVQAIHAEGIPCFTGSCSEVYLEKAFADCRPTERFPIAQELGETSLAFPVHPTLTQEEIEDMCLAVEKVMAASHD